MACRKKSMCHILSSVHSHLFQTTSCSDRESKFTRNFFFCNGNLITRCVYWFIMNSVELMLVTCWSPLRHTFSITDGVRSCEFSRTFGFGGTYTFLIPSTLSWGENVSIQVCCCGVFSTIVCFSEHLPVSYEWVETQRDRALLESALDPNDYHFKL